MIAFVYQWLKSAVLEASIGRTWELRGGNFEPRDHLGG
jgi:hypothetical protein